MTGIKRELIIDQLAGLERTEGVCILYACESGTQTGQAAGERREIGGSVSPYARSAYTNGGATWLRLRTSRAADERGEEPSCPTPTHQRTTLAVVRQWERLQREARRNLECQMPLAQRLT